MYEYTAKVLRVVDGDTVWLDVDLGFDVRRKDSFRIYGINAPETSTEEGKAAKRALEFMLPQGSDVSLRTIKDRREKYGRYLALIFLRSGEDVAGRLLAEGHAVSYTP